MSEHENQSENIAVDEQENVYAKANKKLFRVMLVIFAILAVINITEMPGHILLSISGRLTLCLSVYLAFRKPYSGYNVFICLVFIMPYTLYMTFVSAWWQSNSGLTLFMISALLSFFYLVMLISCACTSAVDSLEEAKKRKDK